MAGLKTRVARIAEESLAEQGYVRPIDVLVALGWLAQPNVDRWVQGRAPSLDRCVGVDADKVPAAFAALQRWAEDRGLKPSEADYQDLQFTATAPSQTDHRDFSAQSVDVRIVWRHWRLPSHGQGGRTVPGLRRPRSPRISAVRRCRADSARDEGQRAVRCRDAVEHATQSV